MATGHDILDLHSEDFVHQSVNKWVDSSIKQDQCVNHIVRSETHAVGGIEVNAMRNYVSYPTDSKHGGDGNHHQGCSLPNSNDGLCIDSKTVKT